MIEFSTSSAGNVRILSVSGKLDPLNGKELRESMNALIDGGGVSCLLVDLEKLEYMASAGFRELFFVGKKLGRAGGKLAVCSLRGDVKRVFELAKFDTAYPVFEDQAAALASLGGA